MVAYVSCRMREFARERGMGVGNRRGGGGKCVENRTKILNSGNEPKNVLKAKEFALSGAQNKLVFERKKGQSNPKKRPGIRKLWGTEWGEKLENGNWELGRPVSGFRFTD